MPLELLKLLKQATDQGDKKALEELDDTNPNSPFFRAVYEALEELQHHPTEVDASDIDVFNKTL